MMLAHLVALDPTPEQEVYLRRACGTARYAYNWGLAEWQRMYKAGGKPSANKVKAAWNAHRKEQLPWTYEVTKCASAQAIINLGCAFTNFFRDLKKPKKERHFEYPTFKRKHLNESFSLWNDQFDLDWQAIRIPKLGWVKMREHVRLCGVILGAAVSFRGGRWFVSIQMDAINEAEPAPAGTVCGIDLGIETLATVSSGEGTVIEKVPNPRARNRLAKRKRRLQRRVDRQKDRAKKAGVRASSRRQQIRQLKVNKLSAREANIRLDAAHKFTTDVARRFETVALEDLNVSGMSKNHALAGALLDVSPYEIRRQLEYKVAMRGGRVVIADRFFPSSKLCWDCGRVNDTLLLSERFWTCECGAYHDRDDNAARNLENVGRASPDLTRGDMSPLPVHVRVQASAVDEPRTGNVHISARSG
jgi:putative transposase